jgi:tRNA (guanosine-2'-O-)-methyltransferase
LLPFFCFIFEWFWVIEIQPSNLPNHPTFQTIQPPQPSSSLKPEREQKIRAVIRQSQPDLTVVLENIFDPLNISAVLRSCDAVGVREVFALYTEAYLNKRGLVLGKRTSGGTFKWIDTYVFTDREECFRRVRARYGRVLATLPPGAGVSSLYEHDFSRPTALLFGNEDEGVSSEALALSDGYFTIPQAGFAESLNISVACAITLFEAKRQRTAKGFYETNPKLNEAEQEALFQRWSAMLKSDKNHQMAISVDKNAPPLLPVYARRADEEQKPKSGALPMTKFEL